MIDFYNRSVFSDRGIKKLGAENVQTERSAITRIKGFAIYMRYPRKVELSAMLWQQRLPLLLIVALLPTVVGVINDPPELEWAYSHYLLNYDDEFIRRGFVGALAGMFSSTHSISDFLVFSIVVLASVVLSFIFLTRSLPHEWRFPALFLFFLHPGLFKNYVYELGRYDQIGIAFLFFGSSLLLRGTERNLMVLLLSIPLVLIHEAMVIWLMPTLVTFYWLSSGKRIDWRLLLCISGWLILSFAVFEYGSYSGSRAELRSSMEDRSVSHFIDTSGIFLRSFSDNTDINIRRLLSDPGKLQEVIWCWVLTFSVAILIKVKVVELHYAIFSVACSILPFFVLSVFGGIDYFRWASLSATLLLFWLVAGTINGAFVVSRRKYFGLWVIYPFIGAFGTS